MRAFYLLLFAALLPRPAPAESLAPTHRYYGMRSGLPAGTPRAGEAEFRERTLYTPAEFAPAAELQMTAETFRRMERGLVGTIDRVADLVVLVRNEREARTLASEWKQLGGNEARLKPQVITYDSFWYQDYGPFYSVDPSGALVSNDFVYNRYNRRNDDAVPEKLAAGQGTVNRKVTMNYEGGNFISDGKGRCFASTRIFEQNPQLTQAQVKQLMEANLGCRELIALTPLLDDITYHIDLFAKMTDDHTFIVGDFVDHPRNKEIMDRNAATLQALGYAVHRLPVHSPSPRDYRTHVNAFLLNGYVLLPSYDDEGGNREAAALYERLGFKVVGVDVSDLTGSGGAVHCILRSKPAI